MTRKVHLCASWTEHISSHVQTLHTLNYGVVPALLRLFVSWLDMLLSTDKVSKACFVALRILPVQTERLLGNGNFGEEFYACFTDSFVCGSLL